MRGADLSRAVMDELTRLDRVDLRDAILADADLRGVSLELTNVVDAKEVKGAQFGNNIGLSQDAKRQLISRGAKFSDNSVAWSLLSWVTTNAAALTVILTAVGMVITLLLGKTGLLPFLQKSR